jgi:hypothetical protein
MIMGSGFEDDGAGQELGKARWKEVGQLCTDSNIRHLQRRLRGTKTADDIITSKCCVDWIISWLVTGTSVVSSQVAKFTLSSFKPSYTRRCDFTVITRLKNGQISSEGGVHPQVL